MSIEVRVVPFASDASLNCELAEVAKKFAVAAARLTTELLRDQTKPPARLEEYAGLGDQTPHSPDQLRELKD